MMMLFKLKMALLKLRMVADHRWGELMEAVTRWLFNEPSLRQWQGSIIRSFSRQIASAKKRGDVSEVIRLRRELELFKAERGV